MASPRTPAPVFGTFGLYRYMLACMVVITHLGPPSYGRAGNYAVFAFYILSGYVVSFILTHHYLHVPGGLRKYAVNRALRIFPVYWLVMLASLALVSHYPEQAHQILPFYNRPDDIRDWLWNSVTVGMSDPLTGALNQFALVPGSWSLGIELLWWSLIPALLTDARLRRRFGAFSIAYALLGVMVCVYVGDLAKPVQYFNALAAALPFCTGLFILRRKEQGRLSIPPAAGTLAALALALLIWQAPLFYRDPYAIGFGAAFAINAVLAAYLSGIDRGTLPRAVAALDDAAGNLAYPIYLVQAPVGLAIHVLRPELALRSPDMLLLAILCSTAAAALLHYAVAIPVNAIRRRIKQDA